VILALFPAAVQAQKVSVLTWHNGNTRTGQNLNETILTPANVNSTQFGQIFTLPVDGRIYAQPLYESHVYLNGAIHNVVYVATENDSVYAFDADTAGPPLWQAAFANPSEGITAVPCTDFHQSLCNTLGPTIGITSTPVIDPSSNTLYVVAFTKENGSYIDRLHALNINSGAEKFGGPVVIQASVPGTGDGSVGGMVSFNPFKQLTREALALGGGVVYIGSAELYLDPFHGWVLGYNATTLQQLAAFCTTPNGKRGGVWGSGAGPVGSPNGSAFFVLTGDGTFDANSGGVDYGDSVVKLGTAGGLPVLDYFTPYNELMLFGDDLDLGAGGGVIMDKSAGGTTIELLAAGKTGIIYVINTANMGKFNANSDNVLQEVVGSNYTCGGGTGTPAYFNNAVYYAGCDYLKMFSVTNGLLSTTPVSQSPVKYGVGVTPSISANGSTNGIVWTVQYDANGTPSKLIAYDATNVSKMLYYSSQNPTRDTLGYTYFAVPTIANGKVYVGTFTSLAVYGLT
jgi:hypothetical protein